ncbi:hypothetical protein D3C83_79980 [compost metagenome]
MEARLESAHFAEVHRQEVEEQRALGFRRERNQLAARVRRDLAVYDLEVGGFATEARTVIHDFTVDLA